MKGSKALEGNFLVNLNVRLQDFHSLATYLSQCSSASFLDIVSDFHLLLFLVTNEVMPLRVSRCSKAQSLFAFSSCFYFVMWGLVEARFSSHLEINPISIFGLIWKNFWKTCSKTFDHICISCWKLKEKNIKLFFLVF